MDDRVKRVGNYRLGRTLGKGAFGRVKASTNVNNDIPVAIKILRKEEILRARMTDQVKNEIEVMRRLVKHKNLVNMVDMMASNDKIYIVMELVLGGELLYHIASMGHFGESLAKSYFTQLLEGLDYIHSSYVVHRDIKPENLLITDTGILKITDFGLACIVESSGLVTGMCGTPAFWSPEAVTLKEYSGFGVDVWAAGVVFYLMLSGIYPFTDGTTDGLIEKIQKLDFKYPQQISSASKGALE